MRSASKRRVLNKLAKIGGFYGYTFGSLSNTILATESRKVPGGKIGGLFTCGKKQVVELSIQIRSLS